MKFALRTRPMAAPEVFATGLIISPRRVFSMRYNSMESGILPSNPLSAVNTELNFTGLRGHGDN